MTIEVPTLNKGHEASVLLSNTSLMMCSLVDDSCSVQRGVDLLLHIGRRKGNYILWIRSPDLDSDHAVVSMDVGKGRATAPPPPLSLWTVGRRTPSSAPPNYSGRRLHFWIYFDFKSRPPL